MTQSSRQTLSRHQTQARLATENWRWAESVPGTYYHIIPGTYSGLWAYQVRTIISYQVRTQGCERIYKLSCLLCFVIPEVPQV